jgi:dTDP-4-dehydrorhamnose reductase
MRFLITGSTGLLGPYLVNAFEPCGEVFTVARNCGTDYSADLTHPEQAKDVMRKAEPDIVIHAAALTDVDACQRNAREAYRFNRNMVDNIVSVLSEKSRLVLISSDQVYPDVAGLHAEEDTAPINTYGESKLAGEACALSRNDSLVVRTNIFGPSLTKGRVSLSDFFVTSFAEHREISIFSDILFSPLHLASAASMIARLTMADCHGVYNLGSNSGMSKADFGLAIAKHLGLDAGSAAIVEGAQRGGVPRLRDMRLDVRKVEHELGCTMPTLMDEIRLLTLIS